jgi:signal transduction histidine kinase
MNKTVRLGPHVRLPVTQTGIGMAESARPHILESFFITRGDGQGTGLGLAHTSAPEDTGA